MIRFLAISFFIFCLTSCSLKTTEGLRVMEFPKNEVYNGYFANQQMDYVYKAKIEVYGRNLGGILIIKKTAASDHRIVMTTEFGSKLLDLNFDGESFTKNFVVEDLDRKMILKVLEQDFKLLLKEKLPVLSAYESSCEKIYRTPAGKGFIFYFYSRDSGFLSKIIKATKSKEKIEVQLKSDDGQVADSILIVHHNFKLRIELIKFNK